MTKMQRIEIESYCKDHSLPLVYVCMAKYCSCQLKLCEKCLTQHEKENQNSNLMKLQNYFLKIQDQVEFAIRQTQKIVETQSNSGPEHLVIEVKDKVEKFSLNQIKILEESIKYLNEESAKVNKQICQSSQFLKAKLNTIQLQRKKLPVDFCKKILENNVLQNLVNFYNQQGFSNFRKKLDKTLKFRSMIKSFLVQTEKYGNDFENFIFATSKTVSSQWSMKKNINDLLGNKKNNGKYEAQDIFKPQQKDNNLRDNNLIKQAADNQMKVRRAKTIFGKL